MKRLQKSCQNTLDVVIAIEFRKNGIRNEVQMAFLKFMRITKTNVTKCT